MSAELFAECGSVTDQQIFSETSLDGKSLATNKGICNIYLDYNHLFTRVPGLKSVQLVDYLIDLPCFEVTEAACLK